jgi:hypothetical protein
MFLIAIQVIFRPIKWNDSLWINFNAIKFKTQVRQRTG